MNRRIPEMSFSLVLLLLAVGCSSSSTPEATTEKVEAAVAAQQYTVRGELVTVPEVIDESNRIRIKHEAMPDFVGHDGEVSGMAAMTMPFALAEGLSIEGMSVGDKVEFVLEVDWDKSPALMITEIRALPPETELTL